MMGRFDEDLKTALGVDVDALLGLGTFFGVPATTGRTTPWRTACRCWCRRASTSRATRPATSTPTPQGDTSVPASGVMPKGGYYFDAIIRQPPLPADDADLARWRTTWRSSPRSARRSWTSWPPSFRPTARAGRALFGVVPGAGLGDIACVPGALDEAPQGHPGHHRVVHLHRHPAGLPAPAVRPADGHRARQPGEDPPRWSARHMDVAWVCGTDFGTQSSTFCSPQTYTELYQPYYLKVNNWIHRHTRWKTFKHCCGSVTTLMEGFIDSGFDILNPVQWTAANMDPRMLKEKFGDQDRLLGRRGGHPADPALRDPGPGAAGGARGPARSSPPEAASSSTRSTTFRPGRRSKT